MNRGGDCSKGETVQELFWLKCNQTIAGHENLKK